MIGNATIYRTPTGYRIVFNEKGREHMKQVIIRNKKGDGIDLWKEAVQEAAKVHPLSIEWVGWKAISQDLAPLVGK